MGENATKALSPGRQTVDGRGVPGTETCCVDAEPKFVFGRLTRTELRRRLWHMGPGLLPFLLWVIPHPDPFSPDMLAVIAGIAVVLGASVFYRWRHIQRASHDDQRRSAVVGYTLPILAAIFLFPADAEIGMTILAILAFGDGSATLGGLLFGGPRLPWNRRKSWSGLLSFLVVGTAFATVIFWGESNNARATEHVASWSTSLLCAGGGVLAAAVAESIPSSINDNVRVGLSAALTVSVLHRLLV